VKLVIVSDTHNFHKQVKIPECDILVHMGDFSSMGHHHEVENFLKWFSQQPAKHLIYIAGNHDLSYEREPDFKHEMVKKYSELVYLENSGIWIGDQYIWGSPYTPEFHNWAFLYARESEAARLIYSLIPNYTTILVTHGPPKRILDRCIHDNPPYPQDAGCEVLRRRIAEVKPTYHLFGHIHEGYGMDHCTLAPTICINASTCDLSYEPNNPPVILEI